MPRTIRRIVTGHDSNGMAVIRSDQSLPLEPIAPGAADFVKIWTTGSSPADPNDATDGAARASGLTMPGGTVLRVVDQPPGSRSRMHRTQSVDYAICLEGRLDMETDSGETVKLKQGDILVQMGTNHAWVNPYSEPARMAYILIDAKPVLIDGKPLEEVGHNVAPSHL